MPRSVWGSAKGPHKPNKKRQAAGRIGGQKGKSKEHMKKLHEGAAKARARKKK